MRSALLLGVRICCALMSLIVLVGSGWTYATYRGFASGMVHINSLPHSGDGIDGSDQNILIVGNDDRSTATSEELAALGTTPDGGSLNTDTIMLLHVPADGRKATLISFPRDSYVDIPGHGRHKINSAYPRGVAENNGSRDAGAKLLIRTIEHLTGLTVDHYVQVDLLGFYRISKAIGGIRVCLNHAMGPSTVYGAVGFGLDAGFEGDKYVYSYSGINLHAGENKIDGEQALAFVRQRHGLNSDLDRIKRQQYFLSAVFQQQFSGPGAFNPLRLRRLLGAVRDSLTTDPDLDPLKLAVQMQNLSANNVNSVTIPTLGTEDTTSDGNVLIVDFASLPAFIDRMIGRKTAHPSSTATPRPHASGTTSSHAAATPTPTPTDATINAGKLGCIN